MPLKQIATKQNVTLTKAQAFFDKCTAYGVPISDLREINGVDGQYIAVTDPNYYDDGQVHEYVVNAWGKDTIVGMDILEIQNGDFNHLLNFAATCFTVNGGVSPAATYAAAVQAVLALPPYVAALNGVKPLA